MQLRHLSTLAAVAAIGVAAVPAAQAEKTITTEKQAFTVSSVGSTVAWSSYDEAAKNYRLMTLKDGKPVALPVAPSKETFQVDLGTTARRAPSRSTRVTATSTASTSPPARRTSSRS